MGGTGIIDQFLETFTRYIDFGVRAARRRGRIPGQHTGGNRYHVGRPVLGLGSRRGHSGAPRQEDARLSVSSRFLSATGTAWRASSSKVLPVWG